MERMTKASMTKKSRLYSEEFMHRGLPRCMNAICRKPVRWGVFLQPQFASFDGEGNMAHRVAPNRMRILCRRCARNKGWMRRTS